MPLERGAWRRGGRALARPHGVARPRAHGEVSMRSCHAPASRPSFSSSSYIALRHSWRWCGRHSNHITLSFPSMPSFEGSRLPSMLNAQLSQRFSHNSVPCQMQPRAPGCPLELPCRCRCEEQLLGHCFLGHTAQVAQPAECMLPHHLADRPHLCELVKLLIADKLLVGPPVLGAGGSAGSRGRRPPASTACG